MSSEENEIQQANRRGEVIMIDRSEVSRALAKSIAFKNVGKHKEAEDWARKLVKLLECADILKGDK